MGSCAGAVIPTEKGARASREKPRYAGTERERERESEKEKAF